MDGLVIVDKERGWTSHDVVARMRKIAGTRRVGHAGTLDPMATGVLILGINRATRLLGYLSSKSKTYEATIRLGSSTITDDAEGEVIAQCGPADLAENVVLAERAVTIYRLEVGVIQRSSSAVDVAITVECSSGTYVRALARDLGSALGVGGHLIALRRTAIDTFTLEGARKIDELDKDLAMISMVDAARSTFQIRMLTEQERESLSHGIAISPNENGAVTAALFEDSLIALLQNVLDRAKPLAVFG
jgi:tRNA pseudouridine55 synthase